MTNGDVIAEDYLIMPQTADWNRYLQSTPFKAELQTGVNYSITIDEDDFARNMSYYDHYVPYKNTGNGKDTYNYVNISKLKIVYLGNNN